MLSVSAMRQKPLSSGVASPFGFVAPVLSCSTISVSTGAIGTGRALLSNVSKPLAACVATVLGLAGTSAHASNTWNVYNCNDSGGGSLRNAVSLAASGDVINAFTFFACSPINLQTAIDVPQASLRIIGDGTNTMLIQAVNKTRVFNHTGGTPHTLDTLYLTNMSISGGYVRNDLGDAKGGCIYSNSSIDLSQVNISNCEAQSTATGGKALGGGIFSNSLVNLVSSNVTDGRARALGAGGSGFGGAVYTSHKVLANFSTISDSIAYGTALGEGGGLLAKNSAGLYGATVRNNQANAGSGGNGIGGGAYLIGGTTHIAYSTISGNHAATSIGGLRFTNGYMTDSTISGNSAGGTIGGASLGAPGYILSIASTTIAFNTAGNSNAGANAAGLHLLTSAGSPAQLDFSVIANNTYAGTEADTSGGAIGGGSQKNLIVAPMPAHVVPADTITGKCPLLYALAFNGGPVQTQTHRLGWSSPARDVGGTVFAYANDQRGLPRVSGPQADLGAYEINQADIIFDNEFDGCP